MNTANAIDKLIEAHKNKDDKEFEKWAGVIAETYEENGDMKEAEMLRSRISGKNNKDSAEVTFDRRPLEYSMQLMYLKTLLRKELITDEEYKRVLQRLRKDYGVVSEWSP